MMSGYKPYQYYIAEVGKRIKQYRINANMTQQDLRDKSGVSLRSISRLEQGDSVQLETVIKVLIALNLQDNINLLIPDQNVRPSAYLKSSESNRKRVRKTVKTEVGIFKWGDENE